MILIAVVFLLSHVLMAAALRATAALLGSYRRKRIFSSVILISLHLTHQVWKITLLSHTPSVESHFVVSHPQCGKTILSSHTPSVGSHAVVSHISAGSHAVVSYTKYEELFSCLTHQVWKAKCSSLTIPIVGYLAYIYSNYSVKVLLQGRAVYYIVDIYTQI